ncbi:MAG: 2-phospho-L-lactate guanylyltransferase [Acidobacteria bacterium]|nr:2-phospho-L-lactate guanylyltransferase [Acidobacteriota bacterium]
MRYLLIPVKDLSHAKQRLAALMTQAERTRLAWAMLENTFAAAAAVRSADRVAIVTLYKPAIELAKHYGMEVILETEQISESASVDFGSRQAATFGAEAVLRLPIDLPLMTSQDIETILAADQPNSLATSSVVIVPSRDGTGTNAILRRPPTLFPSHFGTGSLAKHLREAEQANATCQLLQLPNIALDIDEPEDLAELLTRGQGTPIHDLLMELNVPERLCRLVETRHD